MKVSDCSVFSELLHYSDILSVLVPEPLSEVSDVSGPGSVEALQPFNVPVTDWQSVDRLVDTFQLWRQTAQLQQVNLVAQYYTYSIKKEYVKMELFYLEALDVKANKTRNQESKGFFFLYLEFIHTCLDLGELH